MRAPVPILTKTDGGTHELKFLWRFRNAKERQRSNSPSHRFFLVFFWET